MGMVSMKRVKNAMFGVFFAGGAVSSASSISMGVPLTVGVCVVGFAVSTIALYFAD